MTAPIAKHEWSPGGVSGYPLSHPIVGQGEFFRRFGHFIRMVEHDQEGFVQIFGIIAQWGIGKSRLGYELIAQINDTSRGWFVRQPDGSLVDSRLFTSDEERSKYLGVYIRYSQIANDYQNIDNWFGFGLYKALVPMAREERDASIQRSIAREGADRLMVKGLEPERLAKALEIEKNHTDQELFEDPVLVTRLCEQAYAYLQELGVQYVVVVLDELETAAEAATYGLEQQDMKPLDGRAIKMIGTAIKEEDPRRKLPWLRYVAICSPAIGHELREIQSTARRFELMELQRNAFADVSDFVGRLREDGRLSLSYPPGTIEAAYSMSGGNFGWFNVIMANVDQVLRDQSDREFTVGELFDETVHRSNRVRDYVLDHTCLAHLTIAPEARDAAKELLFGQLPRPAAAWSNGLRESLLAARDEYDEPVAEPYQRVEWSESDCGKALRNGKFKREQELWRLPGVEEPLDLRRLLENLLTYAIHEAGGGAPQGDRFALLLPCREHSFIELVSMLYPHPASEDAARALWRGLVEGRGEDLSQGRGERGREIEYLGPSMEMLGRLDLRLRRQTQNTLLFRSPEENAGYDRAWSQIKAQPEAHRQMQVLVGCMRLLDEAWDYDAVEVGLKGDIAAIQTPKQQARKGLLNADGLKLHPEGRCIVAYVRTTDHLRQVCREVASQFRTEGRTPILALTPSHIVADQFEAAGDDLLKTARSYLLVYQLSPAEDFLLQQVGLSRVQWEGFRLDRQRFSGVFDARLQTVLRSLQDAVTSWRQRLHGDGHIAWPWRTAGKLKEEERKLLIDTWRTMLLNEAGPRSLIDLDETSGIPVDAVVRAFEKQGVSAKARSAGYERSERISLFEPLSDAAEAQFPPFLCRIANFLMEERGTWTLDRAKERWFWGYVWEGQTARDTFQDWMRLLVEVGFARESGEGKSSKDKRYEPLPLTELKGKHREAENWLKNELPQISNKLQQVYGEGRIRALFAPLGSAEPGSKITRASGDLSNVSRILSELQVEEDNYRPESVTLGAQADLLAKNATKRTICAQQTCWVYERDRYKAIDIEVEAIKTLNFEDDRVSLWERIGKAERFAEHIQKTRELVVGRVGQLQQTVSEQCSEMPGFPIQLFTRSLEKIRSIVGAAVSVGERQVAETVKAQFGTSGTFLHNLRDLRLADAVNQLGALASELGIEDLHSGQMQEFNEIQGHIIPTYRDLRRRFGEIRELLERHSQTVTELTETLRDAPSGYVYPETVPSLDTLASRPKTIGAELEEALPEDIERLLADNQNLMRLGSFQPLMQEARKLYDAPKMALGGLSGHLMTLQNSVRAYRDRLLAQAGLRRIVAGLNVLRRAKGELPYAEPSVRDISTLALKDARDSVEAMRANHTREGETLLADAGTSFSRWLAICAAIESHRDPELSPEEDRGLVAKGFLRRTYDFGRGEDARGSAAAEVPEEKATEDVEKGEGLGE